MASTGTGMSSRGGGQAGTTTADLVALIYESKTGYDLTELVDLSNFSPAQIQEVFEILEQRGEPFNEDEKSAFARADRDGVKTALKKIRQRALDKATAEKATATEQLDGATQSRGGLLHDAASDDGPSESRITSPREVIHLIYEAPSTADASGLKDIEKYDNDQFVELGRMILIRGEKLSDAEIASLQNGVVPEVIRLLKRVYERRKAHDRAFVETKLKERAVGYELLKQREPQSDKRALAAAAAEIKNQIINKNTKIDRKDAAAALMGRTTAAAAYKGGLPVTGHSGGAGNLPIFQFLAGPYQRVAQSLGINNLVDFLARGIFPLTRLLCSRMMGLSAASMLVATHRAELMDLPVPAHRAKPPLLKDVLLLSKIGAGTIGALQRLNDLFTDNPIRLDILATLVGQLQKGCPELVGRNIITRHELKAWATAAQRRGSDIVVTDALAEGQSEVELAAERVLAWHLEHRWEQAQSAFDEMVARLTILMRVNGLQVDNDTWKQLLTECGRERVIGYMQLLEREEDEARYREEDMARYTQYVVEHQEHSLLTDLQPWQSPDAARTDRLIGFWMDPIPDHRHMVGKGGGGLPDSLKPSYVCMDPDSGSVGPFSG